jgi:hypothetical protein
VSGRRVSNLMRSDLTPDWCDQVSVDRCLAGKPVGRPLHRAERLAVARALLSNGHGTVELSRLIPCTDRAATQLIKEARCA